MGYELIAHDVSYRSQLVSKRCWPQHLERHILSLMIRTSKINQIIGGSLFHALRNSRRECHLRRHISEATPPTWLQWKMKTLLSQVISRPRH
ncbi:uncharacterized protein CTRU02_205024 [Colletotrichum truncatum]|uniref:Uncharacterized protein n=1 Tax=Colletotrichum truncatum TaxID=5467 RepID=A0ACC3Z2W1_COLTU